MKTVGQNISNELAVAGLVDLPFSWGNDGVIQFDDRMTQAQINAANVIYATHDFKKPAVVTLDPVDDFYAAIRADPTILTKIKAL